MATNHLSGAAHDLGSLRLSEAGVASREKDREERSDRVEIGPYQCVQMAVPD